MRASVNDDVKPPPKLRQDARLKVDTIAIMGQRDRPREVRLIGFAVVCGEAFKVVFVNRDKIAGKVRAL